MYTKKDKQGVEGAKVIAGLNGTRERKKVKQSAEEKAKNHRRKSCKEIKLKGNQDQETREELLTKGKEKKKGGSVALAALWAGKKGKRRTGKEKNKKKKTVYGKHATRKGTRPSNKRW